MTYFNRCDRCGKPIEHDKRIVFEPLNQVPPEREPRIWHPACYILTQKEQK